MADALTWPEMIQIDVTTRCVLECENCQSRVMSFADRHRDLALATFEKILPLLPRVKLVRLFGLGEPLVNRDFFTMAEQVKRFPNFTLFHTNGVLLDRAAAERTLDCRIDRVVFSIDSLRPRRFARMRGGADLKSVLENLRGLADLKRARRSALPEIEVCFDMTRENLWELPWLALRAGALGAEKLHCQYVIPYTHAAFGRGVHRVSRGELDLVWKLTRRAARLGGVELIRTPPHPALDRRDRRVRCPHPFRDLYLRYDGKVCACNYYAYRHPVHYSQKRGELRIGEKVGGPIILGDVHEQEILAIFNGEPYRELRRRWEADDPPEPCSFCYFPCGWH